MSKTVETKGILVLPGLLSWNESPCFLILNNLQATWIKYIKVHMATRWTIRHSLMLFWLLLLLLIGFAQWNALNFIEKIILETKLTGEEYKVKLIVLLACKALGHYIFFFMMAFRLKIWEVGPCFLSLYQDVPHGFDVLVSINSRVTYLISTRVRVIM